MITIRNISKTYRMGKTEVRAVDQVSMTINPGEFVAIMGSSGSGKSTLMHILGLLDSPDSGEFYLSGEDVTKLSDDQRAALRNRLVGFVFQQFHLLARMTALENSELPLIYAGRHNMLEKVYKELAAVGLKDRAAHRPNELSGGQQQRVAIARALVNDPLILMADEPTGNLDSKSKNEIMGILKELNKQGKTIVMVTHESDMASQAGRVVLMRDGRVISDETRSSPPGGSSSPEARVKEILTIEKKVFDQDKFWDSFRQAWYAMITHKMRSFLSILGILIGVAAVIAMLAVGHGAQDSIARQLASLGSNLLTVRPGQIRSQGVALEAGAVTRLSSQDMEAIAQIPWVERVSPQIDGRAQVVYGNKNTNTQVEGVGVDYAPIRASVPVMGRFFNEEEVRLKEKVAVLGVTVIKELFNDADPIGETIKINGINFTVIGILPPKGAGGWHDQDDNIMVPISTAMDRLFGREYFESIYIEGESAEVLAALENAVKQVLLKRHRLDNRPESETEEAFRIRNMADIKETLESTTKTMSVLLGSIAAISLLVGGIGIMNIMLVSVTERTREIGLRKAIGATRRDIMQQFLVESVLMSLIGGLTGIILGSGISLLLTYWAEWSIKISASSVALATIFSLSVGIVFGLWPAHKASLLNPIEALRYE